MLLPDEGRVQIEEAGAPFADTLAQDVWVGLRIAPRSLPSKHLYRGAGEALFDRICALPEYYPTRMEEALLERWADRTLRETRPRFLVELGAGTAAKTRRLLDAAERLRLPLVYCPIDINRSQLRRTAQALVQEYPWLRVRAAAADLEQPVRLPMERGEPVLAVLLGGTIGNFDTHASVRLLAQLAEVLGPSGWLLLGTDRVKDKARLERAYNDSRGVTARFNLNVLEVVNRQLDADFALGSFAHRAFYDAQRERIEMHLVSRPRQEVRIGAFGWRLTFERGETIRTEISRKFTPESGAAMLEAAGFTPVRRFDGPRDAYSLWLARASRLASAPTVQ